MKFEDHRYYNSEILLSNGDKYRVSANWLHNEKLDNWHGWNCAAGFTRLDIDKDFNVHSSQCKNDNLGNIFTEWQPFLQPSICKLNRCTGCTDDLLQYKKENAK